LLLLLLLLLGVEPSSGEEKRGESGRGLWDC
jgi:hypothetical protein